MKAQFNEEVMLAGWSETHNGGAKVTFWLADSDSLESFKTMTVAKGKTAGQRLAMCLVEIADDEQPAQRTQATGAIEQADAVSLAPKITGLELLAVRWCKEPKFWEWLNGGIALTQVSVALTPVSCEAHAKEMICWHCLINSRKELNTNKRAADIFNSLFREPYMAYLAQR